MQGKTQRQTFPRSIFPSSLPPFQRARKAEETGTPPISQPCLPGPSIKERNGKGLEGSSPPGTAGLSCQHSSGMTCRAEPSTVAPAAGYERGRGGWQERGCLEAWLHCTAPRTVLSVSRGERRGLPGSGEMHTTAPGSLALAAEALQHAPTSTEPHVLKEPPAEQGRRLRQ